MRVRNSPIAARLARGASWALLSSVVSRAIVLLSTVIVARQIGRDGFGEFGIVQSTVAMFATFAGLGVSTTATKFVAQYRHRDPARTRRIMTLTTVVACVSGALIALSVVMAAPVLARDTLAAPQLTSVIRLTAVAIFFVTLSSVQQGALGGFEAWRQLTYGNVFFAISSTVFIVVGAFVAGLWGCVVGLVFGQVLGWTTFNIFLRQIADREGIPRSSRGFWAEQNIIFSFGVPTFLCNILIVPTTWICNAILVNGPNGYAEMGLFNAANQWRMAVLFLPTALGASLMPVLSNLHSEQRRPTYRKVIIINLVLAGGVSAAIAGSVAIASPWISSMYGSDFERAAPVMILLCIAAVLISLGNVVGADMAGRGEVWIGVLFCAMVSTWLVVLTWHFVPKYGAMGIGIAYVIAYLIHTVWLAIYMFISLKRLGRTPAPELRVTENGIPSSDDMLTGESLTR